MTVVTQHTPQSLSQRLHQAVSDLRMAFVSATGLADFLREHDAQVLGITQFSTANVANAAPTVPAPFAQVHTPSLHKADADSYEIWLCADTVSGGQRGGLSYRQSADWLFGVFTLQEGGDAQTSLEQATEQAYDTLFSLMDDLGYPHLLRVWNYIADINVETAGLERYRQFNIGRQDAFLAHARGITGSVPAACALGAVPSNGQRPLVVYFLAGKHAAHALENPRQVSAYVYPSDYGPRSPTFSRASLVPQAQQPLLFISGTASIVGHATVHQGDVRAQTEETVRNLQAVLDEANRQQPPQPYTLNDLALKVYVRHQADLDLIQTVLAQHIPNPKHCLYLQADVCRDDLLIEIEATAGHPIEVK